MTNGDIVRVVQGLTELEQLKLPLNIRLSYTIAKDRQILKEYARLIETKQVEIYTKYGNRDKDGHTYTVPADKVADVQHELDELFAIDNEVPVAKVKLDDFGDNGIAFDIVEKLMPIIEEI